VVGTVGAPPHYYLGATVLCQVEVWERTELKFSANLRASTVSLSFFYFRRRVQMVYRRSTRNIRRPIRRRKSVRRRASRPPVRRRRQTRHQCKPCSSELTPAAKFALSQLDPFETRALGAKIPDTNTMPSIANSDVSQVNSLGVTNAGEMTGMAFRPYYKYSYVDAAPAAGAPTQMVDWGVTPATRAKDRPNLANIAATFEAIRPVAHAIRMSSSLAPTTASGFVHIGLSYESAYQAAGNTWQFPKTVAEMTGLAHYKRVTLASLTQSPLTVINKWLDERAFQYQDPTVIPSITAGTASDITSHFGFSWCTIVVLIEGAPIAGSSISFEHIMLSEGLPQKNSVIIGTPAAPNSPGTLSAVSQMVAQQDFAHTEAGQEGYMAQGVQAFTNGARTAGEQVFEQVGLPMLQNFGFHVAGTVAANMYNRVMGMGGIPGVNSNPARLAL